MGREKDRQIEEWEQGWSFTEGTICYRCISDPYLRELARKTAAEFNCSFCNRTSRQSPSAIRFDDLMDAVGTAISQYYGHVENEPIAWDWEDKEYFGTTYDARDLVYEQIPMPSARDDVLEAIVASLGHHIWCDKDPYSLSQAEMFLASWEDFCLAVKHQTRYFFSSVEAPEYSETIPASALMGTLGHLIQEADMIQVVEPGTPFFRVRARRPREVCDSWDSLGPPPPEACVSNRMSAAGISIFYGALELATAKDEVVANFEPERRCLSAGTWRNTRALSLLDLTRLDEIPSFYAVERYVRDRLLFLHHFVADISKQVAHDGRVHIEYVPTQILTEYFRHQYRRFDGSPMDGIIYPSAQRRGGSSIAIFTSQRELDPDGPDYTTNESPILELDQASIRSLRRPQASGKISLPKTTPSD